MYTIFCCRAHTSSQALHSCLEAKLVARARCTAAAPHHWPTLAKVAQTQSQLQMAALRGEPKGHNQALRHHKVSQIAAHHVRVCRRRRESSYFRHIYIILWRNPFAVGAISISPCWLDY